MSPANAFPIGPVLLACATALACDAERGGPPVSQNAPVQAAAAPTPDVQRGDLPDGAIQLPGGVGDWVDGPASLPRGTRMLAMEGHPGRPGMFTMRLHLQEGGRLQPHWHPREERVTILSGLVRVGFGDTFEESTMTAFGPGSFYVNPARSHHYVWVVEETVMQLTGEGPWELHLIGSAPAPASR